MWKTQKPFSAIGWELEYIRNLFLPFCFLWSGSFDLGMIWRTQNPSSAIEWELSSITEIPSFLWFLSSGSWDLEMIGFWKTQNPFFLNWIRVSVSAGYYEYGRRKELQVLCLWLGHLNRTRSWSVPVPDGESGACYGCEQVLLLRPGIEARRLQGLGCYPLHLLLVIFSNIWCACWVDPAGHRMYFLT